MNKSIVDINSNCNKNTESFNPVATSTSLADKKTFKKKPRWLRVKLPTGKKFRDLRKLVDSHRLHTICESGNCPNMGECWGAGTATFMILGNIIWVYGAIVVRGDRRHLVMLAVEAIFFCT